MESTQRVVLQSQSLAGMSLPDRRTSNQCRAKKFYADFTKAIEQQENQLALQALRRQPLDRFVPFAAKLVELQSALTETDVAISFVSTGGKLYATAFTKSGHRNLVRCRRCADR